jgi:hypothetical protein
LIQLLDDLKSLVSIIVSIASLGVDCRDELIGLLGVKKCASGNAPNVRSGYSEVGSGNHDGANIKLGCTICNVPGAIRVFILFTIASCGLEVPVAHPELVLCADGRLVVSRARVKRFSDNELKWAARCF